MILVLGIVACRTFEVALRVPPGFMAGPMKYLHVGTWGLLAFVLFWVIGAAAVATLMWIRLLFRSASDRLTSPLERRVAAIKATTLAALVAMLGLLWWAAITWWHAPLFTTVFALQTGAPLGPNDLSLLNPLSESCTRVMVPSAVLSFSLLFVVWRWWPRLEHRAEEVSLVRSMKWAPIAVTILALVCDGPASICLGTFSGRPVKASSFVRYRNKRR